MGTDIIAFVEIKGPGEKWASASEESIEFGRDYLAFGLLAGVRGAQEMFEPRGAPVDMSSIVAKARRKMFYDDGILPLVSPLTSWLTLGELARVHARLLANGGRGISDNVFAALDCDDDEETRLVFWFDC